MNQFEETIQSLTQTQERYFELADKFVSFLLNYQKELC